MSASGSPAPPRIKFCGLTREADAEAAGRLGAAYAGVIFAGGPRLVTGRRAAELLAVLPGRVRRVGVFGSQAPEEVARLVAEAGLHVAQLHGATTVAEVRAVRAALPPGTEVWAVVRVGGGPLDSGFPDLAAAADAVVVDSLVPGQLGGTGVTADWDALAAELARIGRPGRLVLAGGLRPGNVARAVAVLSPDVLDVSSGVERAPGEKDHDRMSEFVRAASMTQTRA